MDLPGDAYGRMLREIRGLGIPMEACNNFFPASIRLTGEEASLPKTLEYARRATAKAAEMGAKIIVLGSSGAKNIPAGFPYARAREQLFTLLHALQEIVQPLDITVALEPLNTLESNFVCSVTEGLAIVQEVGLSHIQLLADYYHMRMEDESLETLVRAGKHLRHLHIAAKENRALPRPGDGEDYGAFFAALKAADYDARLSVEGYAQNIPEEAKGALALLRPLMG
jgi:sugar phosphate isomerase/epimerase